MWSHSGHHSLILNGKEQYPLFVNSMYIYTHKNSVNSYKVKIFGLSHLKKKKLIFYSAGWIKLIKSDSFDVDNVITKYFYFK